MRLHQQLQYHWWVYADIIFRHLKVFLMFPNLTNLSLYQKRIKFDNIVPTLFIIIYNSKNKLVWLIMSSMFSLFSFQSLEKLYLEFLDCYLFTELYILEWFTTWFFKHAIITLQTYFQRPIDLWLISRPFY